MCCPECFHFLNTSITASIKQKSCTNKCLCTKPSCVCEHVYLRLLIHTSACLIINFFNLNLMKKTPSEAPSELLIVFCLFQHDLHAYKFSEDLIIRSTRCVHQSLSPIRDRWFPPNQHGSFPTTHTHTYTEFARHTLNDVHSRKPPI